MKRYMTIVNGVGLHSFFTFGLAIGLFLVGATLAMTTYPLPSVEAANCSVMKGSCVTQQCSRCLELYQDSANCDGNNSQNKCHRTNEDTCDQCNEGEALIDCGTTFSYTDCHCNDDQMTEGDCKLNFANSGSRVC